MRLALALLLVALPGAAVWGRSGRASEGSCLEVREAAVRMAREHPWRGPHPRQCGGLGGYDILRYAEAPDPASSVELHVVAVYEGVYPAGNGHRGKEHPQGTVWIDLGRTPKPAVLFLSSHEPVLWSIAVSAGARLKEVVIQGSESFERHETVGVPEGVLVRRRPSCDACAMAYAWLDGNFVAPFQSRLKTCDEACMIRGIRSFMGMRESSYQGAYSCRRFKVPYLEPEEHFDECFANPIVGPAPTDVLIAPADCKPYRLSELRDPSSPCREERPPSRPAPAPALTERLKPQAEPPPAPKPKPAAPAPPAAKPPKPARAVPAPELRPGLQGERESLPPPQPLPRYAGISLRARAILLEGNAALATHDAIPDLIEALEKGDDHIRPLAADVLGRMLPPAKAAVPALLKALVDPRNHKLRASAALALGNMGPDADAAVPLLEAASRDKNPEVRYSAREALRRIRK